jgi:hypothetical protein
MDEENKVGNRGSAFESPMEILDLMVEQWDAIPVEFNRSKKDRGITLLARQDGEVQAVVPRRGHDAARGNNQEKKQN